MQEIAPGVLREFTLDSRVLVYKVQRVTMNSLMAWSTCAIQTLEEWPKDRPYLVVHDLSHPGVGLLFSTAVGGEIFNMGVLPNTRKRIDEIIQANPNWQLAFAIVVSPSLSGRMAKLIIHKKSSNLQLQEKAFFTLASALEWLTTFC
jgi:hypothetical protein